MIRFSQPLMLLLILGLLPLVGLLILRVKVRVRVGREPETRAKAKAKGKGTKALRGAPLAVAGRLLAMLLIILAASGPQLISHPRVNYIYFVVDLSGSIPWPREELLELVESLSLAVEGEHLRYGLILFGAEPIVAQGFAPELEAGAGAGADDGPASTLLVPREGTDIAAALELALETFPREGGKEIVLLTDGIATRGEERLPVVLARAAQEGVRISIYPLRVRGSELWLEEFLLPREVPPGVEVELKLKVGALGGGRARLLLYRDERLLTAGELALEEGESELIFHDLPPSPGTYRYRAELISKGDAIPENNALEAVLTVLGEGEPQVLLLGEPQRSEPLTRLLAAGGYRYELIPPEAFTWELAKLAPYRLVILNNVELTRLPRWAQIALEGYVREGGGLLLIQGRRAVEGLLREEVEGLERLLPISYEAREPAQLPSLALVFVLDRSASMTGRKIQLLKEAAAASVELLDERDLLGLCAFHTEPEWLFELGPAREKERIYERLAALQAGGGTNLLPALEEAYAQLREAEAKVKHIVVFSDGKTTGRREAFLELARRIREERITLSAIGIGESPDVALLRLLAEEGGGKLYLVKDPEELAQVTLEETQRIARPRWVTGEIEPLPGPYAHLLGAELELGELPELGGYVLTYPKAASEPLLLTEEGDPLLSLWRYGLGRVGVLNVDLEGRWSAEWLKWEGLPRLFAQLIGQLWGWGEVAGEPSIRLQIEPELTGDGLEIIAEVVEGGRWANLLELRASLSGAEAGLPARSGHDGPRSIPMEQVAPGRYRARVEGLPQGVYLLRVSAEHGGQGKGEGEGAIAKELLALPYPEEYRRIGTDELLLEEIVAATGGSYLELEGEKPKLPEELLAGRPIPKYKELWPLGLSLALIAFIADLFLRKLPFRVMVDR